jgi:glycerate 2-kinase
MITTPALGDPRAFLVSLFETAVRAADPLEAIRAHLPARPKGRTVVIGAGKAASQMAAAFEKLW